MWWRKTAAITEATRRLPILVLGATGALGSALVDALARRGDLVHAYARDPEKARRLFPNATDTPHVKWFFGPVENAEILARAATGCRAVVHALNTRYETWDPQLTQVTDCALNALGFAAPDAIFVMPSHAFVLGARGKRPCGEWTDSQPNGPRAGFRHALEQRLKDFALQRSARILMVRSGDFFGPTVRNGLVDPIFLNAVSGIPLIGFGDLERSHQWAYLPDYARLIGELLDQHNRLDAWEIVHFPGHLVKTQWEFLRLVAQSAGHPRLDIKLKPWSMLLAGDPFAKMSGVMRESLELFDNAPLLDDPRRRQLVRRFQPTKFKIAVQDTVQSYRCGTQRQNHRGRVQARAASVTTTPVIPVNATPLSAAASATPEAGLDATTPLSTQASTQTPLTPMPPGVIGIKPTKEHPRRFLPIWKGRK